jgi:hypothetical protein
MGGYIQLELIGADNGDSEIVQQINNKILSMLIRARIPILRFEAAGGRLQEVFLYLTEEALE